MFEASKTNRLRPRDFQERYLRGKVLDIGGGGDPVCPGAEVFDQAQGDANHILNFRSPASYDTVHSSHCLEHMDHPPQAIQEWWQLVKSGGFLITVVPEEDLYEQGIWPSRFNPGHRATFRLGNPTSWSPVSHDIQKLIAALPGAKIISVQRHHEGYLPHLQFQPGRRVRDFPSYDFLMKCLRRLHLDAPAIEYWGDRLLFHFGRPIDQTQYGAVAQIELIAQKE